MTSNVRDNTERHRFELDADGHIAFSNYKRADGVLTILHTEVPKALEGHGIGSALIRGVLDIARVRDRRSSRSAPSRRAISSGTRNTPICWRSMTPSTCRPVRTTTANAG